MTLRDRDKEIITHLEKFRCMSRDQVSNLFFNHTKNPNTNANYALKRLRDRGYIEANLDKKPFVYFPKPSPIKKDGNKVDHFLAIVDVYIKLAQKNKPKKFDIEPRYTDAEVRPDIFTIFKNTPFWIEVQNSVYTHSVMKKKIELYQKYFNSDKFANLDWQPKNKQPVFPYIILLSEVKYKIETEDIQVIQFKTIDEFLKMIG